ncbi:MULTISPECIES: cutinase family protein [unclassified Streptomyces]|uniref:cutinase family protein n=1 Tax=unclassified Streptomyces TaxID=2593676 RepID=UPI001F03F301|nr:MULTISPECIES: cutinase family protein [unclassified Streptomyces]MCH0561618.1 cutinase family protein [Streptomyces sp. MUM 2J]MCH0568903.1 cutinase family protein [Streptomyces sp. MUM 136J]
MRRFAVAGHRTVHEGESAVRRSRPLSGTRRFPIALCSALAIAVVPSTHALAAPESPPQTRQNCPDIAFIGVHGTDEVAGESSVINETYETLKGKLNSGTTIEKVSIDYGKIRLQDYFNLFRADEWNAKISKGVDEIGTVVTDYFKACGNTTRFAFSGYSSGAWIVDKYLADAAGTRILDKVDGVALYGDPQENGTAAKGIARVGAWGIKTAVAPLPAARLGSDRVKSFCLPADPVCGGAGTQTGAADHRLELAAACAVTPACTHKQYAPGATAKGGEFLAGLVRRNLLPHIVKTVMYQEGSLIYISVYFTDPRGNAEGFGFKGVKGSGWAEENHTFSDPSYGRVKLGTANSTSRIDYPFNHDCGGARQYESDVEFWITTETGARSQSIVKHLKCS